MARRIAYTAHSLKWAARWGYRPYSRYLGHHMDGAATLDPKQAVGGLWETLGSLQLETLKAQGLRPQDHLLDIGCGCLRGGLHFIRYLDPGHYWGLDISAGILEAGRHMLDEAGLADREPHLLLTGDFKFREVEGKKFEFVHAFGVFTDVPDGSAKQCFENLREVLLPEGRFYATFRRGGKYGGHMSGIRFEYPWEFLETLGRRNGYLVTVLESFQHPRGHEMLVARPLHGIAPKARGNTVDGARSEGFDHRTEERR